MKLKTILSQIALLGLLARTGTAAPLGTAFTYQGKLTDGGNPANGSFDLTFTLFDTNSGGWAVAGPLTNSAVAVSNGLFTVALDFGAAFDGNARWLEIGVRMGTNDFTTLNPRQPMAPAPYAMYAPSAGTADSASSLLGALPGSQLSGAYSNVLSFGNAGNTYAGAFNGNGSGLTNLNAGYLASGTLPAARLSGT